MFSPARIVRLKFRSFIHYLILFFTCFPFVCVSGFHVIKCCLGECLSLMFALFTFRSCIISSVFWCCCSLIPSQSWCFINISVGVRECILLHHSVLFCRCFLSTSDWLREVIFSLNHPCDM